MHRMGRVRSAGRPAGHRRGTVAALAAGCVWADAGWAAAPSHAAAWPLAAAVAFGAALALAVVALLRRADARRAAQAAQAQHEALRAALAAAGDLLWHADADGRLRALATVDGRPLPAPLADPALPGRPLWQLGDPQAECPPALRQALATGGAIDALLVEVGRDGERQPWLFSGTAAGADGSRSGIGRCLAAVAARLADAGEAAAQAAEIERLRAEAAERSRQHALATRELESFAHSVSHDLRAPLRVVDGFATILLEDYAQPGKPLDELGGEHLRRIVAAGLRMNTMIDTLLALSRMTSRELARERVDLSQLARELADELKAGDRARRIEFAVEPGLVADGDPTLLRLVLQNLLGNAFKFTGRVAAAQVAVGAAREPGGRLVYCVRDNGAGFDPRFADKMFGLFQRFHSANEFPGTGVGLATVQRILRRHGGRIWAESQPGEGARFFFTLWE